MSDKAAPAGGTTETGTQANVETTSGVSAATATQVVDRARENENTRITNIREIAKNARCEEKISEWVASGKSELEVHREVNAILSERMKTPISTVQGVELSAKDKKRFSFARAMIVGTDLEREMRNADFGLEREVLEEIRKQTQTRNGGSVLPFSLSGRAGIDSSTSTTGGPFKFTQPGEFIELLRNKTSVLRAGATMLTGLTGPVTFPKQNGAATGNWVGENPGSDNTASNLTTTTVSLAFKTVQASTSVSRQALFSAASGNYDLEQIIRADLAAVIGLAVDLGALNGSGSSNQPTGVLQNTSIGSVTIGTNGGSATWNNWVDLETAIGDANADTNRMSYVTNTKQRGAAKKNAVLNNTASGVPIWSSTPGEMDGIVNGYRAIASNQVPRNLTKGTATTACSAILFGAFEHLLVGQFGSGFEVLIDPYSKKNQNMIELTAWTFIDVALRYPEAFSAIKDAL